MDRVGLSARPFYEFTDIGPSVVIEHVDNHRVLVSRARGTPSGTFDLVRLPAENDEVIGF